MILLTTALHEQPALHALAAAVGGTGFHMACDVSDEEEVQNLMDIVRGHWGRLDYALHTASIRGPTAPLHNYPAAVSMWGGGSGAGSSRSTSINHSHSHSNTMKTSTTRAAAATTTLGISTAHLGRAAVST
jgi:NAD(P)-dependent dehydrogenase (short-subunit alcohol dehydrogenase family)